MQKGHKVFSLRIPLGLHTRLARWARSENRSLNNLIETILCRAAEKHEEGEGADGALSRKA